MESKSLLKNFISFLRHPQYYALSNKSFLKKLSDVTRLIALMYLISILAGILISFVVLSTGYDIGQNAVVGLVETGPILTTVILGVFLAPLTEELTFRLGLRFSYKKLALALTFISITIFDLLRAYVFTTLPDWILSIKNFLGLGGLSYLVVLVVFGLIIYFLAKRFIKYDNAEKFYEKNIGKLFYFSVLAFGFIHITNYFNLGSLILLTPIFILPQINAGIFLGYIRMNYGFKWNVFTHSIYNSITIIPFVILSFGSKGLQSFLHGKMSIVSFNSLPSSDLVLLSILGLGLLTALLLLLGLNLQLIIEYFVNRKNLAY